MMFEHQSMDQVAKKFSGRMAAKNPVAMPD
jgi:hypothetical protein